MAKTVIVRNGTILDPSQGIHGIADLWIRDGRFAGIFGKDEAPAREAIGETTDEKEEIDAAGCLVTPGWIDIHAHLFPQRAVLGIEAERVGVRQGVTTLVDAGSAGAAYYRQFADEVVATSVTGVLAWLNIAEQGLCEGRSELADLARLDVGRAVELVRSEPSIVGIKARMSGSVVRDNGLRPLELAKEASRAAGVPVMVHIGNAPPRLGDVLSLLEAGDVVTHAFHGKAGGMFDDEGRLIPEGEAALARGVKFDIGHGSASFSFRTMRKALDAGLGGYTVSTDIYSKNVEEGPVYSLAVTMSKLLALGVAPERVVEAATSLPAAVLGRSGTLGTLRTGAAADVTIALLAEKVTEFVDSEGERLTGSRLLEPLWAIKGGVSCRCG
ncbi:amidohydrolase/deacetylase family metallohydrolase [Paenibacillus flagellatus]|uniref:Amidohydrolase/deacetylase family metallohydrolase n=1 Tax=Paenibacillus flagellatus TaxID=2211139 RepID=A0A2V5K1Z1_9BACL|nr:amidohydrolase/deacetylase family metallohydrolase [Paenibacillus flagellatus]PYI52662.1 amidohydrolase/deacetylase family metallohydrolase [Paenibacillus flagellatus]